jgi:hypothetical protein
MEQNKDNFNVKDGWDFNRKDSYVVNFKGRRYNKCTPTDLDWVLEIKNKVLILAEVKRSEKTGDLPIGQRILAENLCSYIKVETIPVYYLYVKGLVIDGQVEIESATVLSFYSNLTHRWEQRNILFNEAVDLIIKKHC